LAQALNLNIPEHVGIIAEPQRLATGSRYVLENHLPGDDIGVLLLVRITGQLWVEIREQGRSAVFPGILNVKFVDENASGHGTGISEIVLTIVEATKNTGAGSASVRRESAVADDNIATPGAPVILPKVDEMLIKP
jgi:hypothetical protein